MKNIWFITFFALLYAVVSCGGSASDKKQKPADEGQEKVEITKEEKSNGVFEIVSFSNDSVKIKVLKETKFYALALMSDSETYEGGSFANSVGTVHWANGSQFWAGSSMGMPATFGVGAMTLPEGVVLTVFDFKVPEGFKASKIKFVTDGTEEMYYDIQKSSWSK